MPTQSRLDLLVAPEGGRFDEVIGTCENEEIEFKEQPYQLREPKQKWELAKDVAAMANSRGGVIVFGFRTERKPTQSVDTVSHHRPVPKEHLVWEVYRNTLNSYLHPTIQEINGRWFPSDDSTTSGVFVIEVGRASDDDRYAIVKETSREDGTFGGAFGIPIRKGEWVDWMRPEAIHSLIRDGAWWRSQGRSLRPASSEKRIPAREVVMARCEAIEAQAGWGNVPFLALHAVPDTAWETPENFYSENGPKGTLKTEDVLRRNGFHTNPYSTVDVLPDGSVASISNRKLQWLSPDGLFSVAGVATNDWLGWQLNNNRSSSGKTGLNVRVVTEYVLEFSRFFHRHIKPYSSGEWTLFLSCVGFDRKGGIVLLPSFQSHDLFAEERWRQNAAQPKGRVAADHISVTKASASGKDAYQLMVGLYGYFGQGPEQIPYVVSKEVSESEILDGTKG